MEDAFGTLIWVVAAVGALVAILTLVGTGRTYGEIGGSGIVRDGDGAADADAEREEEILQMLQARNARRVRRGEAPLDIATQRAALEDPPPGGIEVDAELREEIRAHVLARNARRVRGGAEPLDVEDEIERRIRDLT